MRTFKNDHQDMEWQWDGEKMQVWDLGSFGWEDSIFVSPEELLECMDVTETTEEEYEDEELPRERDPMDIAHEYAEQRMIDEGEFDE